MSRARAAEIIEHWRSVIEAHGMGWWSPASGTLEDGSVEITWTRVDRSFIYTIWSDGEEDCLIVRGPHMVNDMDNISPPDDEQIVELWRWLYPSLAGLKEKQ